MNDTPVADHVAADPPALDPAALARLERFGGKKLLREMVVLFQAAAPERVAAARAGFEANDVAACELALHSLKSSSAQLGAARLSRLSERGESIARTGTLDGVSEIIAEMEQELVSVQSWLSRAREESDA